MFFFVLPIVLAAVAVGLGHLVLTRRSEEREVRYANQPETPDIESMFNGGTGRIHYPYKGPDEGNVWTSVSLN